MRLLFLVLILACAAIQYPLWMGEFGYARVQELNQQLEQQRQVNQAMNARNNALLAEIEDLKTGTQALEDRARYEMSMIDQGETLVRILTPNEDPPVIPIQVTPPSPSAAAAAPASNKPGANTRQAN